ELLQSRQLREDERLMAELGSPGHWLPPLDPEVDYRNPMHRAAVFDALHLNGLASSPDGLLLSLGRVVTRPEDEGRRGSSGLEPGRWLVGSQAPLAVYAVDIESGKRVATFPLGGVEHEAVYGICPLPDGFGDPHQPVGAEPDAFWKRAVLGRGVTPIPGLRS